ncbi:hypothetical protein [Mycolicibacterium komossense]|uniref:Transposase n=1 Tax=Mycolicibacterium komossense TaxID=1779 RepID=A0ABT3CCP9_9MYCO|nr:hypothetical protein [Mycolicibacterium komossense]MCV7227171.1 hypothetical protein [Mycolicibacterium komossense]
MSVLEVALDPATVIVAIDPGKAFHRMWISNGSGTLVDQMSLSVSREGISQLELAPNSPSFAERDAQLRARGMAPIQARVALARHACRLAYRLLRTHQPFDEQRYRQGRLSGER